MYYCDVERDCPQADGDEPAGVWATFYDSVHDVLVNKKSNALLVFILFPTEKNLVSFLCCCFAKVLPFHFTESREVPSVPVHFPGVLLQLLVPLPSMCLWSCSAGAGWVGCLRSLTHAAPKLSILSRSGPNQPREIPNQCFRVYICLCCHSDSCYY